MIEINTSSTGKNIAGKGLPIVSIGDTLWVEFIAYANMMFSPNLKLADAHITEDAVICTIDGAFTSKSATTLKASGFTDWTIDVTEVYGDECEPLGTSLCLNIKL